jgi:hypothetical protein
VFDIANIIKRSLTTSHRQRPGALSTHRRTGYPSSGCVSAEPDSVSPDTRSLTTIMKKGHPDNGKVAASSSTKTKPSNERPMNQIRYIGMDVHKATSVIVVLNVAGKVIAEAVIETTSSSIPDFLKSQRETLRSK